MARDSNLHLKQQVHAFIQYIRGQTKTPANMINELTSFDLTDATLQILQEILKGLPPPPTKPNPNPKDEKFLASSRDVSQEQPPTTIEVNSLWFQVNAKDVLSPKELTQVLAWISLGTPKINGIDSNL